jgi:hypothetical protein
MGRRGFAFAWLYQALHLPLSLYISIYLCTYRTTAYHTCTLLLNGTRWSYANNNWTLHCIARCSWQARPVRFHSQAQGYMFHDAGTNVKSPDTSKKASPHTFSRPLIIIIIRAKLCLSRSRQLVRSCKLSCGSVGTARMTSSSQPCGRSLDARCLVRCALGCRLMMCRRSPIINRKTNLRSVCMPRFHRLLP